MSCAQQEKPKGEAGGTEPLHVSVCQQMARSQLVSGPDAELGGSWGCCWGASRGTKYIDPQ